jgi:uroporphyrinogen-III synthase
MTRSGFTPAQPQGLHGLRVVAFESRRAAEIAELIRRHGGEPIAAPALREVPLSDNSAALDYLRGLDAGAIDVAIMMTGVGLRTLVEAVAGEWPRERVVAALRRATLVARGPKPAAALRELGLQPDLTISEPNTFREILATLDAQLPIAGKRVAVQEYGVPNQALLDGLAARGAEVLPVPIYRWALPEDLAPLHAAIGAVSDGSVDIALFTSATQVYHLFQVANAAGGADRLHAGFTRMLIASIGPVCSEALRTHGLSPDLEPEHPKMGQLVGTVARRARALLRAKRGA